MSLIPGMKLGPYEIIEPIGSGGMGEVFRARDSRLGRNVAIKVLSSKLADTPEALQRFKREARAVAALAHPNVVAVYDIGEHEEMPYVVSELLVGETLRERIEHVALSWHDAVGIATAIADGLAAAHERSIIHRDLKPENVFITRRGEVKLLDFGLARMDADEATEEATFIKTPTGLVLGTVGYMSPEQVSGASTSTASDVFSFGCVLYEMVSGKRPFARQTQAEVMRAILREEPSPLGNAPLELNRITLSCLRKEPMERPPSIAEVAAALRSLSSGAVATVMTPAQRTTESRLQLAILPFESADDESLRYVAESIGDALSSELTKRNIRIAPSGRVSGAEARDPIVTGRKIGVDYLLVGSVKRVGPIWDTRAEIIDTKDGAHIWSDRFATREDDLLQIIDTASRQFLQGVLTKIESGRSRQIESETSTSGSHALSSARLLISRGTFESLRSAIDLLSDAQKRNEAPSLSNALLAEAHRKQALHGVVRASEVAEAASEAAEKSVGAAVTSESLTARAGCALSFRWDAEAAAADASKAVEMRKDDVTARLRLVEALLARDQRDAARKEMESSAVGEMSAIDAAEAGRLLLLARDFSRAVELCHRASILDATLVRTQLTLAMALAEIGSFEEAIGIVNHCEVPEGDSERLGTLGYVYARWRKKAGAVKAAEKIVVPSRLSYGDPYFAARIHAALGDRDTALGMLKRARDERSPSIVYLRCDPAFDDLRGIGALREFV